MSDDPAIRRQGGPSGGRYVLAIEGTEAELTWSDGGPGRIVADHTYVPERLRGRGIAEKLVTRLIADARAEGLRVVPQCSYVAAQARRHPDWADVIA